MLRLSKWTVPLGALLIAACGSDSGTGPQTEFDGVKYTAAVVLVPTGGQTLLSVVVTLTNTGGETRSRTYPASCPVRIRLYRSADNALLYDETRRACSAEPTATVSLASLESKTLQSGVRFPGTIAGDSLPFTTYVVRAVVLTEGTKEVLINAGTYALVSS